MKSLSLIFLGGLLLVATASAQDDSKTVELDKTPKVVQKTVQLWMAGGSLEVIDEVQGKGQVTYEVDFTNKDGKDRDLTVAANGTLLSLEIAVADAPAPVQKTLKSMIGTGTLESIDKNFDPDGTTFDIDLATKDGKDNAFTLDEDGKIVSQSVEITDIPLDARHLITTQVGSNTIADIEKVTDEDNSVTYQVAMTLKDGSLRSFTVDGQTGQLESMEIGLTEAPDPVQKTVATEMGAGQFESIDKIFDPDGIIFEAAYYAKGGKEHRLTVDVDGKLNSREVELSEVPAAVQETIKQQLGNGKILRIDHSFEDKDAGVFPFEVQAEKNGKPYDFSVGPKGRFLGMDD